MEVENYIEKMKEIQTAIIDYLDSETDDEYQNLISLIDKSKICSNLNGLLLIPSSIKQIEENAFEDSNFSKSVFFRNKSNKE